MGSHPLPGVPSSWHNYIVYSMGSQQPSAIMPCSDADQAVYPPHQHLHLQRPSPPSQVYQSLQPPNRSHQSPKPGGYPTEQVMAPSSRAPTSCRSPTTSALASTRPSPQYPPPSTGQIPAAPLSYPPPPFSPITQFRSPPPPVSRQVQPPPPHCPAASQIGREQPSQTISKKSTNRSKESDGDVDDRLRSVSHSSDKFPPASLNLARVSHQDQLPLSPSYTTMSGVVPLPANVDTSVPPPPLATLSLSPTHVSFSQTKKRAWLSQRAPKVSISEISDMSSPKPVRTSKATNGNIKFSLANNKNDNVFSY